MNTKTMIGIGIAAGTTAVTTIAGEIYTLWRVNKVSKEIERFDAAVNEASRYIDVNIPNELVTVAMDRAANAEASKAAEKAANDAKAIVQTSVDKVIKNEKNNIEASVKTELERQINLVDIEDIKSKVVNKTSASIANDVVTRLPFISSYGDSDIANIIRACKEANMSSWQIEDIVKSVKEA